MCKQLVTSYLLAVCKHVLAKKWQVRSKASWQASCHTRQVKNQQFYFETSCFTSARSPVAIDLPCMNTCMLGRLPHQLSCTSGNVETTHDLFIVVLCLLFADMPARWKKELTCKFVASYTKSMRVWNILNEIYRNK